METSRESNSHILVVEDNPADRTLLAHLMKKNNPACQLHFVADGVEAMEFLRRTGTFSAAPRPTLILLDLNLARKDGRQTLDEIKRSETLRSIPVIVLSTSSSAEDISHAYALSANCYLTKPGDLDEYGKLVAMINTFWLNLVKLPATI